MTGLWWCLTPVVWVFGIMWLQRDKTYDDDTAVSGALVFFVPLWWVVYWVINLL